MLSVLNAILRPLGWRATRVRRTQIERPIARPKAVQEEEEETRMVVKTAQAPFASFVRQTGGQGE